MKIAPLPPDPADREELIWRSVDKAVADYHESRRWAEVARRIDSGPVSNPWSLLTTDHAIDAESRLLSTIFALDEGIHEVDTRRCRYRRWGPRGVRIGGRVYLAIPNPDDEGDPDEDTGYWRMRLVEFEASAIVDLDGGEAGKIPS